MSRVDEAMVEAVASAVDLCVDDWNGEPWSMAQEVARAVLSVPVVRDALAPATPRCEGSWRQHGSVRGQQIQRRRSPISTPTGSMTSLPNIRRSTNP